MGGRSIQRRWTQLNVASVLLQQRDAEIARLKEQLYWSPNGGPGYLDACRHFEKTIESIE